MTYNESVELLSKQLEETHLNVWVGQFHVSPTDSVVGYCRNKIKDIAREAVLIMYQDQRDEYINSLMGMCRELIHTRQSNMIDTILDAFEFAGYRDENGRLADIVLSSMTDQQVYTRIGELANLPEIHSAAIDYIEDHGYARN